MLFRSGLLGAVLVLPQAIAFATLAGLPPQFGLYTAVLPCAVAALAGSSRHVMSGPTNANSLALYAMLAPLAESVVAERPVVDMGFYSLERWPELLSELTRPVFFQRDGSLLVWHRADKGHAQTLMEKLRALSHIWPSEAAPQSLNAQALSELEPSLASTFEEGVWLPQEGQLDNRQLLDALLHSLTQNNVILHWNQSVTLSNVLHETQADWVFDCRGMGGKPDWSSLRGVRGEVIRLHAPEVSIRRPVQIGRAHV